ncbi:MAG: flagellar biosynthesis anti-sigma factor FlgM [Planctomycetota bacterium]|jgi:anti-sigma28 factor (negative regulator of flagellin synthesis)
MIYGCPDRPSRRKAPTSGACPAVKGQSKATKKTAGKRKRSAKETETAQRLLAKLAQVPDVRSDLVQRVRREIDEGTYETPERLDQAVEKLMGELFAHEASCSSGTFLPDEDL